MSDNNARTVSSEANSRGLLDISSLVLLAVLLAAALILNMTLGNALAMTGIKPQFIIAAYALAILLTRANVPQGIIYGLLAAAVTQLSTSIPGLNFLTEAVGALVMVALVASKLGGKVNPLIAAFGATLVSGALFAIVGTLIMGFGIEAALPKVPVVLSTAVFNAVVVQALYIPLAKVLKK